MAFLLSSERPAVAALSANPLTAVGRWLSNIYGGHAKRKALMTLLELDAHRLEDLGVTRQDLFDAIHHPAEPGNRLSARRAKSARDWFRAV